MMSGCEMYRYARDTLLGFASLPSCQPRPDGIDSVLWRDSITSDVVERNISIPVAPSARGLVRRDSELGYSKSPVDDIPEWRRPNGGGAILQSGPRRKAYEEEPTGSAFSSSYPPRPTGPWVDPSGPIRPAHDRPGPGGPPGRWDRNGERDRERVRPPQEWEAEEGGTVGKGEPGPRPWVERDGLLGSGSRPPPQGQGRIVRPVDNYQPSRPLIKTPVYGRREETDVVNDETFGFLEASTDDRSDQERKRREAFEMMRKEQHKQLQEQKLPPLKSESSIVNRKHDENSLWDNPSHQSPPLSPVGKAVPPPVPTPPRPAVPPGFSKAVQHRLHDYPTSSVQEEDARGASHSLSNDCLVKGPALLDFDETDDGSSAHSASSAADIKEVKCATPIAKEMIVELDVVETKLVVSESAEDIVSTGSLSSGALLSGKRSSGLPDAWNFGLEGQDGESMSDIVSTEGGGSIRKESLLDKLFGSGPPTIVDDVVLPSDILRDEPLVSTPDEDIWSGNFSKTSKFAHWFSAKDDKITTGETSGSMNLMSFFGSTEHSDDSGFFKRDVQSTAVLDPFAKLGLVAMPPMPVGPSLEDIEKGLNAIGEASNTNICMNSNNGLAWNSMVYNKPPRDLSPVFMTCEDIEQALLAEAAGSNSSNTTPSVVAPVEPPKDAASASRHLLGLLLKRPSSLMGGPDIEGANSNVVLDHALQSEPSNTHVSEVHTLETLFGQAFMSELQSSEAPGPARLFSDEGTARQKTEATITPLPMHTEDAVHKTELCVVDGPRDWLSSFGAGWNSMWPDSNDVEAGGFMNGYPSKESLLNHPMVEDFEDMVASAPPMPGSWGDSDTIKPQNHAFVDSSNGAVPLFGGATFKPNISDAAVKKNQAFQGFSMQHMSAPLVHRKQPPPPLGNANVNSFSQPAHRPPAQGLGLNNGLGAGFDGFSAPQLIQPPVHSFRVPVSHPPNHLMGQPQILQRPLFHYGMGMHEQDFMKPQLSVGAGVVQVPGHLMHREQLEHNPAPPTGFFPSQSQFQRTVTKSTSTGGHGGAERWFGADGRRSGLMGPAAVLPQAPLGVDGDMALRY